ncbi:MAG: hypothetical protein JRC99_10945 [Deltaproteobacteria bacterium]|nr:hypothetical protein [Deltaproteobacteria bacterium]
MNFSTISFVLWIVFMFVMLVVFIYTGRRSRAVQLRMEEVAKKTLPAIGVIAEKKHEERFGRSATDASDSWYPDKKRTIKAG